MSEGGVGQFIEQLAEKALFGSDPSETLAFSYLHWGFFSQILAPLESPG
jgi:hypothetical protein